jgi:hypothetical protein
VLGKDEFILGKKGRGAGSRGAGGRGAGEAEKEVFDHLMKFKIHAFKMLSLRINKNFELIILQGHCPH